MHTEHPDLIAERIFLDAPAQGIDLTSSEHAFTVWNQMPRVMKHCGSTRSVDDAWELARAHINLKGIYIVIGPLRGIAKFE